MKSFLKVIRRTIYWVLPIIILFVIFQKIDFETFRQNLKNTNSLLVIFGIMLCPITMILGGLRWHKLTCEYNPNNIPIKFNLQHYWVGFPIGVFIPGSLGWDAYRVIAVGRKYGRYIMNAMAIMAEKFIAILACATMIIALYPFMPLESHSPLILYIVNASYAILFIYILAIVSIKLAHSYTWVFFRELEKKISSVLNKSLQKTSKNAQEKPSTISLREMLQPITKLRTILILIGLTIAMQCISAAFNQIFFAALDYDLPFVLNLFVAPILFFIYALPISFGSIGVRETAYIILYGFFGVPSETALIVSFFALFGIMLNHLIGAILIAFLSPRIVDQGNF